ncbi:unnamed protein product [Thlaspi arvense]|uniref:Uncharacterized protein n=1 Tax=Thlaspi arvense TaxID=13288 RepID=A0AAU9TE35_THLAR|nr:unnamed protein product [Thlaspi arvense]
MGPKLPSINNTHQVLVNPQGKQVTLGLGKAVEVLDTLGSSMTSLNKSGGFGLALTTKGSELQILAFEVANTIMKVPFKMEYTAIEGSDPPSEGVQRLVSEDINELLTIVAKDKRLVQLNGKYL